ncbi:VOC family protein [Aestuariivirga sp.]|uniref:VOC family protein n=1 Tax=Aestuariivirga sp. TaxID=2650926 RepID=UPI0035B25598
MRIDHLVWYNADLAAGRRHVATALGAEPAYGGEHPGEGTANAVLSLGPSTYLEILGRDVRQSDQGLDPEVARLDGHGLYHWAVGGVDLVDLARRAAAAGLQGGELVPGGRVKPDGKRLDWLCWGLRDHGFGSLVPFFIDWRASEHPALSAPRGGTISRFAVQTPDAERLRALFDVLGLAIMVERSDPPRVVAEIENGRGRVTLASFVPLPRGYVI